MDQCVGIAASNMCWTVQEMGVSRVLGVEVQCRCGGMRLPKQGISQAVPCSVLSQMLSGPEVPQLRAYEHPGFVQGRWTHREDS